MVITDPLLGPAEPVGMVMVDALDGCKFTRVTSSPLVNVGLVALDDPVGVRIQVDSVAVGFKKMTRPDPVIVMVLLAALSNWLMVVAVAGPPLIKSYWRPDVICMPLCTCSEPVTVRFATANTFWEAMRAPETARPERAERDPDTVTLLVAVTLPETDNPERAERDPDTVTPLVAVTAPLTDKPERAETEPVAVTLPATFKLAFVDPPEVGSFMMFKGPWTLTLSAVVKTSNGMARSSLENMNPALKSRYIDKTGRITSANGNHGSIVRSS